MGQQVLSLRAHVRQCLQDVWDVCRVEVDADGDVPFRTGFAAGWVSAVDGEPPLVRLGAHVAFGVKPVWSGPQCRCDSLRGFFGELWHDVGVRAERQADLAVAENLHCHPGWYALLQ
jgi:hypothetical protein